MAVLEHMVRSLGARAPWLSVGRPILKEAGFIIAKGLHNTIKLALKEKPDKDREQKLEAALIEHLIGGEKKLQFVKLKPGELKALRTWVNNKRRYSNALTDAFPAMASDADIRSHVNKGLFSVGAVEAKKGSAAIYTSTRSFLERVEISPSQLKASVADGYERIVGYRNRHIQVYDAIWLPPTGNLVCIALDLPVGAPTDFTNEGSAKLQFELRQQLKRPLELVNLWPAIGGLYHAVEGKLVDYGFVVGQKQVNHHKARRNSGDLRKAIYDVGGSGAVTDAGDSLDPFKVAIQWQLKASKGAIASQPELLLPGVAGDLNKGAPVVNHAILRNSLSSVDLGFVLSKLLQYLPGL